MWSRVVLRFVVLYFRTRFDGNELEKGREEEGNGPLSDVVGLVSSRLEDTSGPFPRRFRSPSSQPAQVVSYRVRGQETDRSAVMLLEHNRRGNYVYRARHMRRRYTLAAANLQYAMKVRANCSQ